MDKCSDIHSSFMPGLSLTLFICREILAENTILTFIYWFFILHSPCNYAQPGQFYTLDVLKQNTNPE